MYTYKIAVLKSEANYDAAFERTFNIFEAKPVRRTFRNWNFLRC